MGRFFFLKRGNFLNVLLEIAFLEILIRFLLAFLESAALAYDCDSDPTPNNNNGRLHVCGTATTAAEAH